MSEVPSGLYWPDPDDGYYFNWPISEPEMFNTDVATTDTGVEYRRSRFPQVKRSFTGPSMAFTMAQAQVMRDFLRSTQGRNKNFFFFLPNGLLLVAEPVATGDGVNKNFVIAYRDVTITTLYKAGVALVNPTDYTTEIATKAEIFGGKGTFNIGAGNNTLYLQIDGGAQFTVTLSSGATQTVANVITDLNANGTFTAAATADSTYDGKLRIATKTVGRLGSVDINTGANSADVVLGLDASRAYFTGQEMRLKFSVAPANLAAITGNFASARPRILARNMADSIGKSFMANVAPAMEIFPAAIVEVF